MRKKSFGIFLAIFLISIVAGNYASGQSNSKVVKWEYSILKHDPYLREAGSDFKNIVKLGSEGWELAASYPAKGEVIYSIFKRPKK